MCIASVSRTEVQHHSTHHHLYKFWVVLAFSTGYSHEKAKYLTPFVVHFSMNVKITQN
jgi:hypothetical protein